VNSLSKALNIQNTEIVNVDRPKEDAQATWADIRAISTIIGNLNTADFDKGINSFVEWFQKYRNRISG